MLITILFGAVVTFLAHGTYSYEDCKALEFEPKACVTSELLSKAKK